jgi:hypothetical protein
VRGILRKYEYFGQNILVESKNSRRSERLFGKYTRVVDSHSASRAQRG